MLCPLLWDKHSTSPSLIRSSGGLFYTFLKITLDFGAFFWIGVPERLALGCLGLDVVVVVVVVM